MEKPPSTRCMIEANRRRWDELVGIHARTSYYDVEGFLAGNDTLHPLEVAELGEVTGRSLLHLQCHFGLDTLSWARRGARVTGVDISGRAIATARELAGRAGLDARFVEADVLELDTALDDEFDVVFVSYGAICWLPDLRPWGRIVARFLRPGGTFYMAEVHPFSTALDEETGSGLRVKYPYASGAALRFDDQGTYADRSAVVEHRVHYVWEHGLGDVVNALIGAGLRIEFLREHDATVFPQLEGMVEGPDGLWRLPADRPRIPLLFSLAATRPGGETGNASHRPD